MAKKKIRVQDIEVRINAADFICLTDIAKKFNELPDETIRSWIRNRNTLEFLATWEELYNRNFKPGQMAGFTDRSGLNSFRPTVKKYIETTGANSCRSANHFSQSYFY